MANFVEKRKYYRVKVKLAVIMDSVDDSAYQNTADTDNYNLLCQLQSGLKENQHLLHSIAAVNQNLADYLALMTTHIDGLTRCLISQELKLNNFNQQWVNLSEGGICLQHPTNVKTGSKVVVKLLFPRSQTVLALKGIVIRSTQRSAQSYQIALGFDKLAEHSQSQLARQIFASQAQIKGKAAS